MTTPIVEVKNLSFQYDRRLDEETLTNVSFSVKQGEWIAIVGTNGSGKSTLAQLLVGLLMPHRGSVQVAGIQLNEDTKWEIRKLIGLVFQNPDNQFVGTTVQDDVAFGLENLNVPFEQMKLRVERALDMVGMTEFSSHDPSRLSGGQKQRVAIAGSLALNPSILLLDEAFVMLDPTSRSQLLTTLRQLNKEKNITIISITHDMNEAAVADRVVLMKSGKITMDDKPSVVFTQMNELEPPFAERIRRTLKRRGRDVPNTYMTENELVQWLWK